MSDIPTMGELLGDSELKQPPVFVQPPEPNMPSVQVNIETAFYVAKLREWGLAGWEAARQAHQAPTRETPFSGQSYCPKCGVTHPVGCHIGTQFAPAMELPVEPNPYDFVQFADGSNYKAAMCQYSRALRAIAIAQAKRADDTEKRMNDCFLNPRIDLLKRAEAAEAHAQSCREMLQGEQDAVSELRHDLREAVKRAEASERERDSWRRTAERCESEAKTAEECRDLANDQREDAERERDALQAQLKESADIPTIAYMSGLADGNETLKAERDAARKALFSTRDLFHWLGSDISDLPDCIISAYPGALDRLGKQIDAALAAPGDGGSEVEKC